MINCLKRLKMRLLYKILIWAGLLLVGLLMYKFIIKDSLIYVVNQSLPNKEAALLNGMLWGEKDFDKDFYNQLKNSGLLHIVVVSGANMILIFKGLVESLAKRIGRKWAIGLAWLVSLFYLNIVGWEIPIVRALILVMIMYWAQILGRKYNVWRGLIFSGLIIVLAWPKSIMELSFWLSFGAFFGVVSSPWKDVFRSSFWVSLWISPIMALGLGKINLVGPISNVLVLFIVEVVTIVGFLGSIVGLIIPMIGKIILWLIMPLLKYFVVIVEIIGNLKWVNLSINFNWMILLGWYLILIYFLLKPSCLSINSRHPPLMKGGNIKIKRSL